MSKKVMLHVLVDMKVRDRDIRALAAVNDRSQRPGSPVNAPVHLLANDMDVSPDTTRRALIACQEQGFLRIVENRLSTGGQVENSYSVLPLGLSVVDAARDAGLL